MLYQSQESPTCPQRYSVKNNIFHNPDPISLKINLCCSKQKVLGYVLITLQNGRRVTLNEKGEKNESRSWDEGDTGLELSGGQILEDL